MLITHWKASGNVMIVFDLTDLKHRESSESISYVHCWSPCQHRVGAQCMLTEWKDGRTTS